jgi:hypothetical protein
VDVADGDTVDHDVLLVGGTRVAGTVRADSDGRPLPEADVMLLDTAGNVVASRQTGSDGGYAFDDVPGGEYRLVASGYAPVADDLRVAPGEDVEHHFVLGAQRPVRVSAP